MDLAVTAIHRKFVASKQLVVPSASRDMSKVRVCFISTLLITTVTWTLFLTWHCRESYIKWSSRLISTTSRSKPSIVIVTYMRSGSTLLGEIFRQNPNVLYLFEPLRVGNFGNITSAAKEKTDWLKRLSSCNFSGILEKSRDGGLTARRSKDLALLQCSLPRVSKYDVNLTELHNRCHDASYLVAIKTIRLQLADMEDYLLINPEVKVVHLIRDPRAVHISRREMPRGVGRSSLGPEKVCTPMWKDINASDRFLASFGPERIFRLTYDELILNLDSVVKKLYEFAGMPVRPEVIAKLYDWTHADAELAGGFKSDQARNGLFNLIRWREKMSEKEKLLFENHEDCRGVINTIRDRTQSLYNSQVELNIFNLINE